MSKWQNWNNRIFDSKLEEFPSEAVFTNHCKEAKLSIIILTFRRTHLLVKALESAINQDFNDEYDIVILDDCPNDLDTYNYIRSVESNLKNFSYYRNTTNIGQYPSWNRAAQICKTEWFVLLHDDDQLLSNYLSTLNKTVENLKDSKVGLIGVYFRSDDQRSLSSIQKTKNKSINFFVDIFIALRGGNPIYLDLRNNIDHIFVLSCTLFINKKLFLDVGGINNEYYPSSDFVLSSKMNYFYKTLFLPKILSVRGIGENESLKRDVCEKAISNAYYHTLEMLKVCYPNKGTELLKFRASISAIIAEIGVIGYNNLDYSNIKLECGINRIFNSKLVRFMIFIYSRIKWGMLLIQ